MRAKERISKAITRRRLIAVAAGFALVAVPAIGLAHVERASYWPDPAPDTAVTPPAGGAVPAVRSVYSALDTTQPGVTHVVCQPDSMKLLKASLASAQTSGYQLRPSQPRIFLSKTDAQKLQAINGQLFDACTFHSIQAAVTASGNNDRVEVMPGTYTEPDSRAVPNDPAECASLKETNDKGETGAVSYRYQYHCPNAQNLIAVIGRKPAVDSSGNEVAPPQPPLTDRHGIPDLGPCIRCNLQIQGTGVKPDDVTVDGGNPADGDHSPAGQDSTHYSKDVGIRADRADGFVLDNVKVRHVNEHDVYVTETDGFNLDNFKTDYAGEYGVLTFVGVHGLIQNCSAWGNGDSGLYPGAAFDQGKDAQGNQIYNNEVRNCDSYHNSLGYSGTDGNAVYIHDNNFYENAQGLSSDVFTAPGHPGFPQHGDLVKHNNFYSNNYNPYLPICGTNGLPATPGPDGPNQQCSDFTPSVPVPVGTGMWWAGGNDNTVDGNRFWNNWRRGAMLYAVPDQLVCGPGVGSVDPSQLAGCDPTKVPPSTSYDDKFVNNIMGVAPDGSKQRNGTDFWWDQFAGNTGNCWKDNTGVNGDRASLTSVPPINPLGPGQSVPGTLPEDCSTSIGTGGPAQESELLGCFADITFSTQTCDWFTTPKKP